MLPANIKSLRDYYEALTKANNMSKIFEVIEEAIKRPPIPHDPNRQSLKAWAMYCLRDRGFKVVYAQNADFAVETKGGEKLYFKVTNSTDNLEQNFGWIVWDSATQTASLIPPK